LPGTTERVDNSAKIEDRTVPEPYEIVDPRPVAALAKYTYFLPTPARLDAIGKGDLVKVTIRAVPPSAKWDAERMWIKVLSVGPDWLEGTLESQPDDMPGLDRSAVIRASRTHVIDVVFENPDQEATIPLEQTREFWERCWVDQAVLNGDLPVQYIYREEPDSMQERDQFPDSGWRVRGDMRGVTDEKLAERKIAYVALGAVLNKDDSWVHLIDEPIGVAYEKNFEEGVFVRQPDYQGDRPVSV
jgi:hypothetical protein